MNSARRAGTVGLLLGLAVLGGAATAAGGEKTVPCPVAFTNDSLIRYDWKHATRGMNVYSGHLTLVNRGDFALDKVEMIVEIHDIQTGEILKKSSTIPVAATLAAGKRQQAEFNIAGVAHGDEFVVLVSATRKNGSRATWKFSAPVSEGKALSPPKWLDPDTGAVVLLAQRIESGKPGVKRTPAVLYVKIANLSKRPAEGVRVELTMNVLKNKGRKKDIAVKQFTWGGKRGEPLEPGGEATDSFKFDIPGEMTGHSLRIHVGAGSDEIGESGGGDDEDDEDDEDGAGDGGDGGEDGIQIGRIELTEENDRIRAVFGLRNNFKPGEGPKRMTVQVVAFDKDERELSRTPLRINNVERDLPSGKMMKKSVSIDRRVADRVASLSVEVEAE